MTNRQFGNPRKPVPRFGGKFAGKAKQQRGASPPKRRVNPKTGQEYGALGPFATPSATPSNSQPTTPCEAGTRALRKGECLCTVCTCGRHHCPKKHKSIPYPKDLNSEYINNYPQWDMIPTNSMKPTRGEITSIPFAGASSMKHDFPAWDVAKPHQPGKATLTIMNTPFAGSTSYSNDFVRHPLMRSDAYKPPGRTTHDNPFIGESSMREDFEFHRNYSPPKPFKPEHKSLSSLPFYGQSTNRVDFVPKDSPNTAPIIGKDNRDAFQWRGNNEWGTEYKGCYTPKRSKPCPAVGVPPPSRCQTQGGL